MCGSGRTAHLTLTLRPSPLEVYMNPICGGDSCGAAAQPLSWLDDGGGPVAHFDVTLTVQEEYQNEVGNWVTFLPDGSHYHEWRGSDYKSRGTILDDNIPDPTTWLGPWKSVPAKYYE